MRCFTERRIHVVIWYLRRRVKPKQVSRTLRRFHPTTRKHIIDGADRMHYKAYVLARAIYHHETYRVNRYD